MIDPQQMKFLDLVAWSEGTSTSPLTKNNGYDVLVTGVLGHEIFTDYTQHPFEDRPPQVVRFVPLLVSTAAGRYQILLHYWKIYKVQLNLKDFSPASQDAVAIQLLKERRALPLIDSGDIQGAIQVCSNIWASLPGNNYAQGGKTMAALLDQYQAIVSA